MRPGEDGPNLECVADVVDATESSVPLHELVAHMRADVVVREVWREASLPKSQRNTEAKVCCFEIVGLIDLRSWKASTFDIELPALRYVRIGAVANDRHPNSDRIFEV